MKLQYRQDFTEKEKPFIDLAKSFDLEKYGKIEHFNMIGRVLESDPRRVGKELVYISVINTDYSCKAYGYGCTTSIPESDWNEEEVTWFEERRNNMVRRRTEIAGEAEKKAFSNTTKVSGEYGNKPIMPPK